MEIIADNEEIRKLSQNNNFEKIKVCLNGIYSSGKTTFLKRITSQNNFNIFKELIIDYLPSICATFKDVIIKFKNKVFKLIICDVSGKLKYFSLLNIFNQKANIILNFFNPFNKESFEYIKKSYQKNKRIR